MNSMGLMRAPRLLSKATTTRRDARAVPATLLAGIALASALVALACALPGCSRQPAAYQLSGETMGTTYSLKIVSRNGEALSPARLQEIAELVAERLEDVNRTMSTYDPSSELSRFNSSDGKTPFRASPSTVDVLSIALRVSEETGGAFDVTVGPLVNAWGFGPSPRDPAPPDDAIIEGLRERVGYRLLEVSRSDSTVRKARPDVYVDLSALAKGYAVDRAAEALESMGIERYMVEVGGEIRTAGENDRGQPWQIAIEKPDPSMRAIGRIVSLSGLSVATSGDYRNFFEREGQLYCHILDPRTGRPVRHPLASVSVFHESCAVADAYATAILVLGPEEGYRFAVEKNLAVLFIVREAADVFVEKATPAFEKLNAR